MFRVTEAIDTGHVEKIDARVHCRFDGVNPSGFVQRAIVLIARCRATKSQPGDGTISSSNLAEFHSTSRHHPRKCQKNNLESNPPPPLPDSHNAQTVSLHPIIFT